MAQHVGAYTVGGAGLGLLYAGFVHLAVTGVERVTGPVLLFVFVELLGLRLLFEASPVVGYLVLCLVGGLGGGFYARMSRRRRHR